MTTIIKQSIEANRNITGVVEFVQDTELLNQLNDHGYDLDVIAYNVDTMKKSRGLVALDVVMNNLEECYSKYIETKDLSAYMNYLAQAIYLALYYKRSGVPAAAKKSAVEAKEEKTEEAQKVMSAVERHRARIAQEWEQRIQDLKANFIQKLDINKDYEYIEKKIYAFGLRSTDKVKLYNNEYMSISSMKLINNKMVMELIQHDGRVVKNTFKLTDHVNILKPVAIE